MTRQRARCRHRHDYADFIGVRQYNGNSHVFLTTEIRRCVHCDAWLGIGKSRDDSEAVALEIRAAEIAASRRMLKCDVRQPFEQDCERCGFEDWGGHVECTNKWHAGYLARCIAESRETDE